jgi:hypothetical protein
MKEFAKWCKKNDKDILCLHVKKDNEFYAEFKKIGNVKEEKTTVFIIKKDFTIGYHFLHPKTSRKPSFMQHKISNSFTRMPNQIRLSGPLILSEKSENASNTTASSNSLPRPITKS